eukprot:CAMPEP_0174239360 /NCGR_PEP_ID=MMETSP0417-20130205/14270_1 /TAXON_ID=242541 /ORGANISM="Mayorella sp, Strain BSH-02190019" /LENGTH=78 /DNA_ID=CAMNT_0015318297 /DNA_START=88 /DNA_END=320 /DNA_ORIENTATION=-
MSETLQEYSAAEVAKHNTQEDCWIIMYNKVFNVTDFLLEHPGGEMAILDYAGEDATDAFEDIAHSEEAQQMLDTYLIG